MSETIDRIGVVVDGQLIGTAPAFPNGIGDMFKTPFFLENRTRVWPEMRQGEVVLLKAEDATFARKIPGFEAI